MFDITNFSKTEIRKVQDGFLANAQLTAAMSEDGILWAFAPINEEEMSVFDINTLGSPCYRLSPCVLFERG